MKKIFSLAICVLSLSVFTGYGCVDITLTNRDENSVPGREEKAVININREIAVEENINTPADPTAGWEVYQDTPWGLEIKYPSKYKTVYDTYGWPHALVHFIEKDGAQAYRAQIETWDNESGFRDTYNREPVFISEHPNGKNWVTIDYTADSSDTALNEEWWTIISTFRFGTP